MRRVLLAAAVANLWAAPAQSQAPSQPCAAAAVARAVPAFIECARAATRKYADRSLATRDGYRRIGRDFPAMGEHWINAGLVFDGKFDPARPEILTYIVIDGAPRLLGVAYALPLLAGESPPDGPVGPDAWHDHSRTVDDETVMAMHHAAGQSVDTARLAVLHAWIWSANPSGVFAAENWSLPYVRLGLIAPDSAPDAASRALALVTGGAEYYALVIQAAASVSQSERAAVDLAMARARDTVVALVHQHSGSELTPAEIAELCEVWRQMWATLERSMSPQTRQRIQQLSIR